MRNQHWLFKGNKDIIVYNCVWNVAIEVAIQTTQDRILKLLQHFTPHTIMLSRNIVLY